MEVRRQCSVFPHLHRHLLFLPVDLLFCIFLPFILLLPFSISYHISFVKWQRISSIHAAPSSPLYLSSLGQKKKKSHYLVTGVNREWVKEQTLSVALQSNSTPCCGVMFVLLVLEDACYHRWLTVCSYSWLCCHVGSNISLTWQKIIWHFKSQTLQQPDVWSLIY